MAERQSEGQSEVLAGSCLCGGVGYEITGKVGPVVYCHCVQCRKANGTAFAANADVRTRYLRFTGDVDSIREYESSPGKIRAFCTRCGAPVPIHDPEQPFVVIPAGCLDEDPGTRPFRHIFVGLKAPWYEIHDDLPQFEGHVPPEQRLPRKAT